MADISAILLKRLAFVRVLFLQGVDQTQRPEPFSALGILSLHDAVELWLVLAGEHLGANLPKHTGFLDYWEKLKRDEPLNGRELPSKTAMARLNSLRVNLKHHGAVPSAMATEQIRADVTTFLRESTALVFDQNFDQLTMTDLVTQAPVRLLIAEAEQAAQVKDWVNALAGLQKAFRALLRDYSERKRSALDKGPFEFGGHFNRAASNIRRIGEGDRRLGEVLVELQEAVEAMQTPMEVLATGLDYRRYARFSLLGPEVWRDINGGWHVDALPGLVLSCDEYDFAYNFVVESSLRLAELDFDLDLHAIRQANPRTYEQPGSASG